MSLLRPTLGDLLDRHCIVSLKLLHGGAKGRMVSHFIDEFEDLSKALWGKDRVKEDLAQALANVHRQLWRAQDKLESFEKLDDVNVYDVAYTAFEIRKLNRERARLKKAIDKESGEFLGEEKIYPKRVPE